MDVTSMVASPRTGDVFLQCWMETVMETHHLYMQELLFGDPCLMLISNLGLPSRTSQLVWAFLGCAGRDETRRAQTPSGSMTA